MSGSTPGLRVGCSSATSHTAIIEAKQHLEDGYGWCVDLDLEKFDLVCHQRLTAKLAERVSDRQLLVLIGRMLKAKVVLPDGVVIDSEQGVPQGSPLSPLLSNIVLDELDSELARRGHRFVRYGDDAKVYVSSERAGRRVMASLTEFIERRLRLKVNEAKSAAARPEERHFLGFRLRLDPRSGTVLVLLSERTMRNAMERVRQLTPRNWGGSLERCIARSNAWVRGWHGFFGIASVSEMQMMRKLDAHIRRRLRAIMLRHWKRKRTIARRLIKLGVKRQSAWRQVYAGRKSWWALSHTHAVDQGLRNAYFAKRGLTFLVDLHRQAHQHTPEGPNRRPVAGAAVRIAAGCLVQRRDPASRARHVGELVDVVLVVLEREPFVRDLRKPVVVVAGNEQRRRVKRVEARRQIERDGSSERLTARAQNVTRSYPPPANSASRSRARSVT